MMGAVVDETLLNKRMKIVFDDGGSKPFSIEGTVIGYNSAFLMVLSDNKERVIPLARVIRMEVVG